MEMMIKPEWAKENTLSNGGLFTEFVYNNTNLTNVERVIMNASSRGNKSCQINLDNYDLPKEVLEINGYVCSVIGELEFDGYVEIKWF
jgi:hypothetical protein